jgi:hypothetical protein
MHKNLIINILKFFRFQIVYYKIMRRDQRPRSLFVFVCLCRIIHAASVWLWHGTCYAENSHVLTRTLTSKCCHHLTEEMRSRRSSRNSRAAVRRQPKSGSNSTLKGVGVRHVLCDSRLVRLVHTNISYKFYNILASLHNWCKCVNKCSWVS